MENQAQIEKQISKQFDRCEKVGDTLLRCERRYRDNPWAVIYFDVSGSLPKSPDELTSYLDNTIAKSYYTTANDLKWNHYLVFVAGKPSESLSEKQFIEEDRNYARKFVIDENSLANFLRGYQAVQGVARPTEDVFSRWASSLDSVGLQGIVDDRPRATLVEEYLSKDVLPRQIQRKPSAKGDEPEDLIYRNSISKLEIRSFLPHPVRRNFTFARVNLITGPNGVGKTSLLEAIEYFICGATKRGLLQPILGADIRAQFNDTKDVRTLPSSNETFRKRDLRWYGRNYDRGNKLAESFNRYNFFNSDAAFDLAHDEDEASIKESLSRLALGDEANRLWDRIVKTLTLFENEQRPIQHDLTTNTIQLNKLRQEMGVLRTPSQNVDVLFRRVTTHLGEIRWKGAPEKIDEIDSEFSSSLQQVVETLDFMARVEWMGSPLTTKRIGQEAVSIGKALQDLKDTQSKLAIAQKAQTNCELTLSAVQSRQRGLTRLFSYLEPGIDLVLARKDQLAKLQSEQSYVLSQVRHLTALEPSQYLLNHPLPVALNLASQKRLKILQEVEVFRSELTNAESAVNRAVTLLSELRAVADALFEQEPTRTTCPICHTDFGSAEAFRSKVAAKEDESLSSLKLDKLRANLMKARTDLGAVDREIDTLNRINHIRSLLRLDGDMENLNVEEIRTRLSAYLEEYQRSEAEVRSLDESIAKMRESGFTAEELRALSEEYMDENLKAAASREELLDRLRILLQQLEAQLAEAEKKTLLARQEVHELQDQWIRQAKSWQPDVTDDQLISNLETKYRTVEQFLSKLEIAKAHVALTVDADLRDFRLRLAVASEAVQKMVQIRDAERSRHDRLVALEEDCKTLESKVKQVTQRNQRCDKAINALRNTVRNDNREGAVSDFLKAHKKQIGFIFERIHAPKEFVGLSNDALMLVKTDGKMRALNQISSGQRSALALAIFFTLNGLSDRAPPLILMDDPVINVDDLNTLAFFDNLRELVLMGKRQVFFSTANSKLAALFEKKFSFLGEKEFQLIPLTRN